MENRLYRSTTDKKISGVCGGIGEHYDVDSTIVRIVWIGIALITLPLGPGGLFIGGLAYLACRLIIPPKPNIEHHL